MTGMDDSDKKIMDELVIPVSEHPKAWEPTVLVLNVLLCVVGAIIGLELIVRTGVTPNTSIIGALFAIILSRIPISIFKKYRSIHRQNLIQTAISGATFSAANCMILPIGIPVVMGRPDLMYPMLIGVFIATIIDATILYKSFDTEMFPAEGGAWPPGIAAAESILAVVEKGKKAMYLLIGIAMGCVGKFIGIPMDLLGVGWFANFGAMLGFGIGMLIIGIIKTNGFMFSLFGHSFTFVTNLFGEGFVYSDYAAINYAPHGVMIGAGIVALIQCGIMLLKKSDKEGGSQKSAASNFTSSMANMKKGLGLGFVAYLVLALAIALVGGLYTGMGIGMLILWIVYAAFAAIASELIVGISAMHSGWFPGFATALIFLIVGMLLGFPPIALALLVGYTAATGPAFSDMAYDLKCGYILRGSGADPELEKEGRKQQYITEVISFVIAFAMVAFLANKYFDQGMFVKVSETFATTIDAGTNPEIAKWLLIWAIPGALIQILGGHRQIGILFATGLLVGSTINGLTILVALLIRVIAIKVNKDNDSVLNILGAGALAGAALYSFFTATLGLAAPKKTS